MQTYMQGAVTICMEQAAGADDWSQEPWAPSTALPTNTHPCTSCSKVNAPVRAPTTGADLEGDQAKDFGEWLALRSLPCLPQPSSIQDNAGVLLLISLAMSSGDKALLWERIAQSHCHLHPLAHEPCFVPVLQLEINTAAPSFGG